MLGREIAQARWLRRRANLPLRQVATIAAVSAPRISQLQRAIEDAGRPMNGAGRMPRRALQKRCCAATLPVALM
ncbi:MAG: hypothetical protein U1E42_01970 [Rhodospirillales bacterium]